MGLIEKEIEAHYRQGGEAQRLANEWGELERARTQSIMDRHLPPAPATIMDVGGAAGAYAFPLAERGYHVHLIDPVELHLEQARTHARDSGITLASIVRGDARRLEMLDQGADAMLLLGPLYHLPERPDRLVALREAWRVLRPGGVLFAAAISRFASLIDGLARGFFRDAEFRAIIEADLASGRHHNPTQQQLYFTTAYFHRSDELEEEICEAGFRAVRTFAIEGPAWSTPGFRDAWNDPAQRAKLLEFLATVESEPSLLGASAHMLGVGFR